jgi:hypothetical protein
MPQILQVQQNNYSVPKEVAEFAKSGYGAFRLTCVIQHICDWTMQLSDKIGLSDNGRTITTSINGIFGQAKAAGSVAKLFGTVFGDFIPAIKDSDASLIKPSVDVISDSMRVIQLVQSITKIGSTVLKKFVGYSAETAGIISDGIDLKGSIVDFAKYSDISKFEEITENGKTFVKEKSNLLLIKMISTVTSIACTSVCLLSMYFGFALAGSMAFLSLATFGTAIAIYAHFYEKFMTYTEINDDSEIKLSMVKDVDLKDHLIRHIAV